MIITRIQVEEGFLNGLDLRLRAGLNVIIGSRGTGKTSIVELIRFALGVQANTQDSARKASDHARSILGSGQVTLTLEDGTSSFTVTRTAEDEEPRSDGEFAKPIVFAQSEIEQVGELPAGRLRILDAFLDDRSKYQSAETRLVVEARSATSELMAAQRELADFDARLSDYPAVDDAIAELQRDEAAFASTSAVAAEKIGRLDVLAGQLAAEGVAADYLSRLKDFADYWVDPISDLVLLSPSAEVWQGPGPDPVNDLRPRLAQAEKAILAGMQQFAEIAGELEKRRKLVADRRLPIEEQARAIRREVDAVREGAGQVARRMSALKERKAQLDALRVVATERRARMKALQDRRGQILDKLESLRQERFDDRQGVAASLNKQLKPRIRVTVTRAGDVAAYLRALAEGLRGSGLKYNELSSQLSKNMSPRELLEAIELNDFETISQLGGIGRDRAARLISHFQESGLESLVSCHLEDQVEFYLMDGGDYKDVNHLSTGQRCTIILPILLEHKDRILILDQPEDHIDNAFITDTVIQALNARSDSGQILISTHNANIPVLGGADLVVQMASDGRVGFVRHADVLEAVSTIEAITALMEGGRDAFKRRAAIYDRF